MILRLLLRWFLCCLFLFASASGTLVDDINTPDSRRLILEDIALLLASFDVTGLCHPTSNHHAPIFPKCELPMPPTTTRLLEDQDENADEDNYYNADEDDEYDDEVESDQQEEQLAEEQLEEEEELITKWYYILHASLTIICVIVGALASGLYIGMLSLDPLLLVIKARTAKTESERRRLERLLALVKQRHQLIVTLLIVNCVAAESMPIFLQHFVHDGVAVVASVVLVLLFGEILPALIFTGSDQVEVACRLSPLVRVMICLLYPLAYPVAYLLEVLSHDGTDTSPGEAECLRGGTLYSRGELAALIRIQYEERRALRQQRKGTTQQIALSSLHDVDNAEIFTPTSSIDLRNVKRDFCQMSLQSIDSHDVNMVEGALQLKTKTALDIYRSYHKVFCIPNDMVLNEAGIFTIYASGYSRCPVFIDGDRRKVKGILMTRKLMVVKRNEKCPTPADFSLHIPRCVAPDTNLVALINLFQSGGSSKRAGHIALVCARPHIGNVSLERGEAVPEKAGLMGIVTLEDVLEALLQEQIYDEMDVPGSGVVKIDSPDTSNNSTKPLEDLATIRESNSYHQMA